MSEPPRGVVSVRVPHPVQGKMYHRTTDVQTERAHQTGRGSGLRHGGAHEPRERNTSVLVTAVSRIFLVHLTTLAVYQYVP